MKSLKLLVLIAFVAILVGSATCVQAADIGLTKGVTPETPNIYRVGETIHYVMTVANLHPTETIEITLVEDLLPDGSLIPMDSSANPAYPNFPYDLVPGVNPVQTYMLDWVVPPGTTGSVVNDLRCMGVQYSTVPDNFDAHVQKTSLVVDPCIEVTKIVECDISKAGDEVLYRICVTNCSDPEEPLINLTVIDDVIGDISSYFPSGLAIGETACADVPYVIQADDPDPLVNTVTATAEDEYGYSASDYATEEVDLIHPSVEVFKECLTPQVPAGGNADFGITINNTGDCTLIVTTTEAEIPGPLTILAGDFYYDMVTYPDPGGVDCVYNEVTVTWTLPAEYCNLDNTGTAWDEACCDVVNPCIAVTKVVECDISKAGDEVIYHICVTNCSDPEAPLFSLTVIDDVIGDLAAYFPAGLAGGETACAYVPYVIQADDPDPLVNTVTATAENEFGTSVSDYTTEEVDLIHPSVEVFKTCLTPEVPSGGDAQFGITINNTGDCTLIVTTTEAEIPGPLTILAGDYYTDTVTRTDPGGVDCVYNDITVTWTLPAEYCDMDNTGTAWAEACCDVFPPCIEVTKVVECDISKAGDEVIYHICVTNCSELELFSLTVMDDVIGDLAAYFPSGLLVGETACADIPYVIQVDDPDPLVNTVTATAQNAAGTSTSDYATEEVDLIHPSVEVFKECLTPQVPAGGDAQFGITINNTGDCTLIVTTTEAEIPGPLTILAGDSYTDTVTRTDPGGVDCVYNDITVTWTLPAEYCDMDNTGTAWAEACCDVFPPCIEVTKVVECDISKAGDEVIYHICVTNCSALELFSLTVIDDVIGDLAAYFPSGLLVGETACADIPYVIQVDDPDPLVNTVTVTAQNAAGTSTSDYATEEVDLIHPSVEVFKECLTPEVPAGGDAEFGITINNTGDCTLIVTTTEAEIPGPLTILAGDSYTDTVTRTDPGGVDCVYNDITVTWTLPAEYCNLDNTGTAWAEACCDVFPPCIEVTKEVDCDISKAGDEVIYHICVTNCSELELFSLTVMDDVIGDLAAYFPSGLLVGETACADIPYVIQVDDPDPLINTVTATAQNAAGTSTSDYATEEVDLIHPSVEVFKECLTPEVPAGGDAEFGITINNTGDCTLIVTTTEAEIPGPLTILAGDSYTDTVTRTDPGGVDCVYNDITVTWTLPAEYCEMDNTGTAWAEACCDVFPPCIEVTKVVECDISKAGDEVIYHICVTNCSELELFSLTVIDDVIGDLAAYFPSGLLVGETACADIPYVIQVDDPDPLVNTVTVTAQNAAGTSTSDYATEEVDLIHPSVEVFKECLTPEVPAGGDAEFGITINNTGDCTLIVTTTEAEIPGPLTILAGDSYTDTVTRTDPGGVDCVYNDITVTWTLPAEYCNLDNTGTAWAEACCDIDPPCVEVTKEVDCDISKAGDEVIYHICVTNCSVPAPAKGRMGLTTIGDRGQPLFNLTVVDDVIGDISSYFPSGLAAGETACADIPYVIQVDDPDPLVNTVTVTAENSAGTAVSDYATEEVDLIHPSVEVFKTCLTPEVPSGGDAEFGITINNTGDCTLIVTTTEAEIPGPLTILAGDYYTDTVTRTDPGGVDCVYNDITVTWTLPAEYCDMDNTGTAWAEACCDVFPPCIEVTKVVECDISKAGDEVIYHICVTNCSELELFSLTVVDDVIGDLAAYFPSGLLVGETACADIPYVIQVDDPDPLVNTVTVTAQNAAGTSTSDYATEEVDLIHPSVEVFKECLTPEVPVGGDAEFGITINNTGDCTLIVTTTEAEIPGPLTILAGDSYTDTVTRTDPGGVDCVYNDITVTWTLPAEYCNLDNTGTAWAEACCDVFPPCIEVTKVVECDISKAGDEVIYHICVTNCSELELFSLTVIDDVIGDISSYFPAGLLVGETACADIPYVIQVDDPDPLVNTVTATAQNAAGTSTSDYATEEVDLIHPSVEVFKECLTPQVPAGGDAQFGITINNTGDCTLIVTTTEAEIPGPLTILAGASYTDTVTRTDPGGVDCVYNDITVTWTLPAEYCDMDNTGTAWAEACCDVFPPCIEVTKVVECDISKAGDEVIYHICVTNCSALELFSLTVVDDVIGDISSYFPSGLLVGETACADIPYVIQVDDPDPLINTVTATAQNAAGTSTSDYATEEVDLIHPSVEVFKECLTPQVPAGGDAQFGITINNTGDCTLIVTTTEAEIPGPLTILAGASYTDTVTRTDPGGVDCVYNDITVTWTLPAEYCNLDNTGTAWAEACCDVFPPCIEVTKVVECDISKAGDEVIYHICVTNCSELELFSLTVVDDVIGDISSYFPSGLLVGETACADIPYVIQVDDPDPLINTATATAENAAGTSTSDYATEEVDLIHPSVEVFKECLTPQVPAGGDAQFGITINNTGDCTLIVTTTEAEIPGPLTILAGASYTDTVTRTDPGGVDCVYNDITVTWTLPAEYCNLDNTGTAWAEACCDVFPPCIEMTKEVECDISKAGDEVIYHICVTNCSELELFNLTVVDDVIGDVSAYFPAGLGAGEAACADIPYVIQVDDPDPLINTATATAENAAGTTVSIYATEEVDLIHPSVEVFKECLTPQVPAGGDAQFGITINNTGDCTLIVTTTEAEIPGPLTILAGASYTDTVTRTDPGGVDCVYNDITVTWTLPAEYCNLDNTGTAWAEACCEVSADCRWTGGGTIEWEASIPEGAHVTHGFEFHCDLREPNRLEVNWEGNRWHMMELLSAWCHMNPDLPPPNPPTAECNEVFATGEGRYNNVRGYIADFHFTDVGQPGVNDYAHITITAPDGTVVLEAEGNLSKGNHQAHKDNK